MIAREPAKARSSSVILKGLHATGSAGSRRVSAESATRRIDIARNGKLDASALLSLEQGRHTVGAVTCHLDNLDLRTRFVALALLAELHSPFHGDGTEPAHPLLETVRITGQALARYSALAELFPSQGENSRDFLPEMEELRRSTFEPTDGGGQDDPAMPAPRPRNGDILFDIVPVREWGDSRDWSRSSVSWLVRAGQWAYWSMNEASRILLCRIAAASLTHRDPVVSNLTLRLGRQIGFATLLDKGGAEAESTIEFILRNIGELPAEGQRDSAWHARMYRQFNMALFSLSNLGAVNDVTWPTNYRFTGLEVNGGAPDDWITGRIRFKPPLMPRPRATATPYRAIEQLKI